MKSHSDHQHRLTAAREAVVEAAKEWFTAHDAGSIDCAMNAGDDLDAAVARLLEVESENG